MNIDDRILATLGLIVFMVGGIALVTLMSSPIGGAVFAITLGLSIAIPAIFR